MKQNVLLSVGPWGARSARRLGRQRDGVHRSSIARKGSALDKSCCTEALEIRAVSKHSSLAVQPHAATYTRVAAARNFIALLWMAEV